MALIRSVAPDVRELIAYVVAGARERRVTLNRTRLVKLLYLVDVESVRTRRDPVTGLRWSFLDFGPHAPELVEVLVDMERASALYRAVPDDAPDGEDWIAGTRRTVDSVVERFAALSLDELLDHVYFHTGPMAGAERGGLLDMRRARDDASPRRPLPLHAPAPPDDVEQRVTRWRASTARRLAPLGPRSDVLADREDDSVTAGVRGRLHVAAGSEL